jgi:hypothetical protein
LPKFDFPRSFAGPHFAIKAALAAYGPTLPTLAVRQVGSYPTYTGRDANIVAEAARVETLAPAHALANRTAAKSFMRLMTRFRPISIACAQRGWRA